MAGLKVPEVARTLHVTERTVYAWFSGATAVPYAAYKLLRVLGGFDLPGDRWAGWCMHSGKLWTPEGFGFEPGDGVWWAGVCRRARLFHGLYRENGVLVRQLAAVEARAAGGLVSESTSGFAGDSDVTGDITLTSKVARDTRYQNDHGMTSCPTHSGFLMNSMRPPVPAANASESASTRLLPSPSMPTFVETIPRPLPLAWPLPRLFLGWSQSLGALRA